MRIRKMKALNLLKFSITSKVVLLSFLVLGLVSFILVATGSHPVFADPQFSCSPTHTDKCNASTCVSPTGIWVMNDKNNPSYCDFGAGDNTGSGGSGSGSGGGTPLTANSFGLPQVDVSGSGGGHVVQNILQVVFGIAGALALLMIVVSGLAYVTSAGDPQKASKAKNGIVYSVSGLAVCILAELIVTFVIGLL